jgi:Xaa-Pro aminopeptidase
MRKKNLKYVLLEDVKGIYYFSGYSILFPGVKNRAGLLVDVKGRTTLVVSAPLAAGCGSHAEKVVPVEHSYVAGVAKRDAIFGRTLKAISRQTEAALKKSFSVISPDIAIMRQCKDAGDKRQLRRLARLARVGYDAARSVCLSGRTELDLFLAAKTACVTANKQDLFVFGDFVSGKRSLEIAGPPTTRKLRTGENVIVDLWLIGNHYWSDTAQTLFVDGCATKKQLGFLEMLENVKRQAERTIRPGVKTADVYWQMQHDLRKYGYTCPHHMGHGFGLDFWEPPFITADSTDVFHEDMAFNLELGVYDRKHHGFRIEESYFVTKTGVTCFTRFS